MGYFPLWKEWAALNPDLIRDLREKSKGKILTDQKKVDLFASLMGDLSFEYQDAVIAANYVEEGKGNAIEQPTKFQTIPLLKILKKHLKTIILKAVASLLKPSLALLLSVKKN